MQIDWNCVCQSNSPSAGYIPHSCLMSFDLLVRNSLTRDNIPFLFCPTGSFHLMRLLFDDYILYVIENLHMDSLVGEFLMHMSSDRTLTLEPSDSFFPGTDIEYFIPHFLILINPMFQMPLVSTLLSHRRKASNQSMRCQSVHPLLQCPTPRCHTLSPPVTST